MKKFFLLALVLLAASFSNAQTADEILAKYFENTGGVDKWKTLSGIKMSAKVNQMGMDIPLTIYQMKDGRTATIINFQGKEIKQGVFDGTNLWSTNFMTMKAEKSDAESTENFKTTLGDFPDPFLDYKSKGYKVELVGKETVEGAECFKIKLIRKPILVDGKQEENSTFYFFDANDFVPIMTETEAKSGPGKGMISQSKMSDYQEVNGMLFPFSMTMTMKGAGQSQTILTTGVELNPKVDAAMFALPADK
ncbi:MAG: outer membrane lipoprotein-sorting protein [Cyclobacteriaceae bacterium]|jgi:outer membrane lipoprotein-sorting protein